MKLCGFVGMLVLALVTVGVLLRHRHGELSAALLLSIAASVDSGGIGKGIGGQAG